MKMNGLNELLEEEGKISAEEEGKILQALNDFNIWLKDLDIVEDIYDLKKISIEPYSDGDWVMKVEKEGSAVSFNPQVLRKSNYDFFEIVILHEFFHLIVQGVPNKEDATQIKDCFGSDFMSLIDIEADFYVASYLKNKKNFDANKYWKAYYEGTSVFKDKWVRNKKFERFLGSLLTVNKLFNTIGKESFDLYLPSISPFITEGYLKVLVIKRDYITFKEITLSYDDFRDIKEIYKKPSKYNVDSYVGAICEFSEKALNNNKNLN
ncbi:hypothetical protein [Flavobacterium cerinum]|uniref:IrrE N-terminal-like domain-containing protein n=1 Tax=Flavobacterium cerinum TaxID=2502784 RepID=A0ABY5ITR1_9FLAO|nr:hypothetical protein [Flavobacterium cerinum]UUC46228.1 hypothetical protein NOX80_03240 [Flavobacterium cerinum]